MHTPASSDYQNPEISYLDILREAKAKKLDAIAFTDHNTVVGFRRMQEEIEQLRMLKELDRILPAEATKLGEYEDLLKDILVLPGFEFTASFGFHILGLFAPDKPLREIEHILLELNIPSDQLDEGSVTVGASADVLSAYSAISEAGGLAIAAHANSSNGIAMRGFAFGGQTKIAYTQDPNLVALEVTDLEKRGRYSTANFFSGKKPEYPRRMHCIQGSDAHRLKDDPKRSTNLGVGGRVTEMLLSDLSFKSIQELFASHDFARTRPRRRKKDQPDIDFVSEAREEGRSIVQDFHTSMTIRGGNLYEVIADICAFANTNGGTIFIGMTSDPKDAIVGVKNPSQATKQLDREIGKRISPPIDCTVDSQKVGAATVLRVLVPRGEDQPYAIDDNKIYIRSETVTNLAVRDEIVSLVTGQQAALKPVLSKKSARPKKGKIAKDSSDQGAPRTGVEVVSVEDRDGSAYYTVRDLRNGNVVKNVTEQSARKLWHYAIKQYAELPADITKAKVNWAEDLGVLRQYSQFKQKRFDLVQKADENNRFFYGVTEDGIHGKWSELVGNGE